MTATRTVSWVECNQPATHEQCDRNGKPWADLCGDHHERLEASLGDAKKTLGCWVKAQGGAKAAARRFR